MELEIRDEFIKLGQALKLAGIASSGIEAKILIEDKKISRVSYLPAYIPEDFNPYVVKPDEPLFETINDYMRRINDLMGIPIRYTVDGEEVRIEAAE